MRHKFKHQILIASFHRDFEWLRYCLLSLERFATGFLPTVIAYPEEDLEHVLSLSHWFGDHGVFNCEFRVWNGPGFGRAQDAMMSGDILCPEADYFWLLGSDCLAIEPFTPDTFCFHDGRPVMLWNSWEVLAKHHPQALAWRSGVEEALGWPSHGEFMRKLPLAYPRAMMEPMRVHIANRHGVRFTPYVHDRVNRVGNFSESNVMGEWMFVRNPDAVHFVNIDEHQPEIRLDKMTPIRQFWSHGGFDRVRDGFVSETPRKLIESTLGIKIP